jgi:hypothetical protein
MLVTSESSNPADPVLRKNTYSYLSNLVITGLNSNSQYRFLVQAVNDPGYSPYTSYAYINQSYSFDGSSYLSLTTNSNLPLGNDSYTIEAWIKISSFGDRIIAGWGAYFNDNQTNAFRIANISGGDPISGLRHFWWANDLDASVPIADNQWHHVVAQFDGTTRSIYVDGILANSDTPTSHNVTQYDNFTVGSLAGYVQYNFIGNITNLRIVKGVAVYTGNFTVPTSPLTATQPAGTNINAITAGQTALLLNVYSTIPYIDSSEYGYTMTVNGTPIISTDTPF